MSSTAAIHPIVGSFENDTISGTHMSDVISGKGGDDTIIAQNGNDDVWGGSGDDLLYGNNGQDIIYGGGGPDLIDTGTYTLSEDYDVKVIFEGETAGYRNSFGYYRIISDTNTIEDVTMIWENASLVGSGGDLIKGVSTHELDLSAGDTFGVFIVSNGYSYNNYSSMGEGKYDFRNADGSIATINSINPQLWHIADNGIETQIKYHAYHSAGYGDNLALNPDGLLHTTAVMKTDAGTMTVGFEDLYNGGDRDFDDSVFTLDIGTANATFLNAHFGSDQVNDSGVESESEGVIITYSENDTLYGGTGQDELWGRAGDDVLYGNTGADELHGGSGQDSLYGGSSSDLLYGNDGDDLLDGGRSADDIFGGKGNDSIFGDDGSDTLYGDSGDDELHGGKGYDKLFGGSGIDFLYGDNGADVLSGGSGNDTIFGGKGNDELYGGSGNDELIGGTGHDIIDGGSGYDTVRYDGTSQGVNIDLHGNIVTGGAHDTLTSIENAVGSNHDDVFRGNKLDNVLNGGDGNDILRGYTGQDTLLGGDGADSFVYLYKDLNGSVDHILDFDFSEGDTFGFSGIFSFFDPSTVFKFIDFVSIDNGTTVRIDNTGTGGVDDGWVDVVNIDVELDMTVQEAYDTHIIEVL